ncbi:MAG: redoxin domain-containing protein [Lysinibacillus sp.]
MKKKNIGLLVIILLVAIMIGTYVKQQIEADREITKGSLGAEAEHAVGLEKGKVPPNFTLSTLDGKEVTLSELKGKKVVLNFWATWCPPCKAEMPHMQNYYEQYAKDENVEILAVNITAGEKDITEAGKIDIVQTFANSYELTFPILLDKTGEVGEKYQVLIIPTTYFIDSKGFIQNVVKGPMNMEMLEGYVSALK